MIPKIIHYCWFGNGEVPDIVKKCLNSWKEYLPKYELKLWDENNFDVTSNRFTKEAYEAKKYAFVADYVRLYTLYHFGGVYMDADVEIIKNIDKFLYYKAFTGFENSRFVPTGIMAAEKDSPWAAECLAYYKNRPFILPDGSCDIKTNCEIITEIMVNNGFILNNKYQVYKDELHVFPSDFFCPLSSTRVLRITNNTFCIHHFTGSWGSLSFVGRIKRFICRRVLGVRLTDFFVRIKRKILRKPY